MRLPFSMAGERRGLRKWAVMVDRCALILAEAANPEWTSVPLIGWSLSRAIQRHLPGSHIVTQVRNREAFIRAGLREGTDFTAIDTEKLAAPAYKAVRTLTGGRGALTLGTAVASLVYPYFEHLTWKQFGEQIGPDGYQVVHRVTPVSPTSPSPIASKVKAKGASFVMGPINGGVPWPKQFDKERRKEGEWLSYVRGLYKLMPGRTAALNAADAVICGSRFTQSEVPRAFQEKTVWMPENAIEPDRFSIIAPHNESGVLKIVLVGRLVPYKGADMLLEAAAPLIRRGQVE